MTFTPPVADLTAPAVQNQLEATLLKTIHEGRKNTAMGPGSSSSPNKTCAM